MVQAQVDYLRTVEELSVVEKEIARLKPATENGAVPQKLLLDRVYEQQKLQGSLKAQRESLLLHGLTEEQADVIQKTRSLQSKQTVFAPGGGERNGDGNTSQNDQVYVIEDIDVELGRYVNTGDLLLTLADYSNLYVEGNAFEQDGQLVADAVRDDRKITIRVQNHTSAGTFVPDLSIQYLSDKIDPVSRTLHFYLELPNDLLRDVTRGGHRYLNWRYKPGQRTELLVPVEEWPERIVLPADAVVQDGVESYVFQENGDHFDRRAVQVEYRDRFSVVVAKDGSLFPGDVVATSGAQQLLVALKNKSGGGIDPHAGHSH
jgi:multidrug efflux pump subunit AcrA (membrane-fusion protein)